MSPPMPPSPPSPPIISRDIRDSQRNSSRSHHRTARDYRASRSRSRGRGRISRSPDRRQRHRSHSRSRSRETSRYQSSRRPRYERSRSRSRVRSERRRHNSYRSRSRSHTRTHRSSHRSRSRSKSRSRRRNNRSRSKDTEREPSRSRSKRREERRGDSSKQPNVIVLSTESYKDSLKSSGQQQLSSIEEYSPLPSTSSTLKPHATQQATTPSWKTVRADQIGVYSNLEPDQPIDKEKIHKEIEEKLRLVLAREGKVYPYPKPEPSHPVFANDGSFLEIFKKMQQQQTFVQQQVGESMLIHAVPAAPVAPAAPVIQSIQQPPPPQIPVFSRRRGGKILKTGVVAKPQAQNDTDPGDVKDFWSIYLREVKKYKSTACESDSKTRPLVR